MSLNFTVTPGKVFVTNEKVNTAKLNQLGVPVIQAEGVIAPADMAAADYSGKLTPGAYCYTTATLATLTYTTAASVTTYVDGLWLAIKLGSTSPAAPLLDAGAGAKPLYQYGARTAVEAGDLLANTIIEVRYNSSLNSSTGGWEVLTLIGPRPARSPFQPASAYLGGEQGLVPRPNAGQQNYYLRADGTWGDPTAAAIAAVNGAYMEVYKQQNFI